MSTTTQWYSFVKFAPSELIDEVTSINNNMDSIDTQIKNRQNEIAAFNARLDVLEALKAADVNERTMSVDDVVTVTTNDDLSDLTIDLTVAGVNDVFMVVGCLDVDTEVWFDIHNLQIELVVDGTPRADQILLENNNGLPDNYRRPVMKVWRVTGMAAGTRTVKLRARLSVANGTHRFRATHCQMFSWKVDS